MLCAQRAHGWELTAAARRAAQPAPRCLHNIYSPEERRGLDYVATRSDLDASRVAYIGWSVDGGLKLGLPAIDTRYRSVVLMGAALYQSDTRLLPEINPINLVPYIRAPKLLLQGRYDEDSRLKTQAEPLHKLLASRSASSSTTEATPPHPTFTCPPSTAGSMKRWGWSRADNPRFTDARRVVQRVATSRSSLTAAGDLTPGSGVSFAADAWTAV